MYIILGESTGNAFRDRNKSWVRGGEVLEMIFHRKKYYDCIRRMYGGIITYDNYVQGRDRFGNEKDLEKNKI